MACHIDIEGFRSVMPAKAGTQEDSALAASYAA
jgi:hypothetical protein